MGKRSRVAKAKAEPQPAGAAAEGSYAHVKPLMGVVPPSFDTSVLDNSNKIEQLRITCRDSRKCQICPALMNSTKDPVFEAELIYWSRPPRLVSKEGEPEKYVPNGTLDYYCFKVYTRMYAVKFKTVELFIEACGKTPGLLSEFQAAKLVPLGMLIMIMITITMIIITITKTHIYMYVYICCIYMLYN